MVGFYFTTMLEPFQIVYEKCKNLNTPGFRHLQKVINKDENEISLESIVRKVTNKSGTKFKTYREVLNPKLEKHEIYDRKVYIPDYLRKQFTRLRLISHNLKIETGRWSNTPVENRVCKCDRVSIQNEIHVLLHCPLSRSLRQEYITLSFNSLCNLINCKDLVNMCKYIKRVLQIFQ